MAAAVASTIDLNTQASIPIRLGSSILQPSESKKYSAIRYNHKPRFDNGENIEVSLSILPHARGLVLKKDNTRYKYGGREVKAGYVLLPRGSGKNKEMVLEKLSTCTDFEIVRVEQGKEVIGTSGEFPKLPRGDSAEEQFADNVEDLFAEPVDPSNPFDYRNYLAKAEAKPRSSKAEVPREAARTSQVQVRKNPPTPLSKPSKQSDNPLISQKKRKAADTAKSNPKRVKAGEEPPVKASTVETKINTPRVVLDRKASLKLPPFEDSGELIVDDETPVLEKPRSAMHLALTGQLGGGPISLHSAANSPAGRKPSPDPTRPAHVDEDAEFELGGSSPEASQRRPESDDEEDADVEDMDKASPEQPTQKDGHVLEDELVYDEEGDLERQVALAMLEGNDEEEGAVFYQHESEEESEEE